MVFYQLKGCATVGIKGHPNEISMLEEIRQLGMWTRTRGVMMTTMVTMVKIWTTGMLMTTMMTVVTGEDIDNGDDDDHYD